MDLFERVLSKPGPIGQFAELGHGYLIFPKLTGEIGPRMTFNGRERLVWCVNNYLGLANHPEVRRVDAEAAARHGLAATMGSRAMSGESEHIERLESELAALARKQEAALLNFGYQGMFSAIDALVDVKDVIVFDAEVHACAIDGARLHRGKRLAYAHNDVASLAQRLELAAGIVRKTGGGILVITEGVFSMAGDQGKLREIVALKNTFDFRLLVDDAHGFGTMGAHGAGTADHQGVQDGVDLYFATFTKAMASIGAFIAGDAEIVRYLRYNIRSQTFSKTLPLPIVIGALTRLRLLRAADDARRQLWAVVRPLHAGLRENGFDIGRTDTPITPVYFNGHVWEAMEFIRDLREQYDIFSSAVTFPVVPPGTVMLRLIPTCLHTLDDVTYTVRSFCEARPAMFTEEVVAVTS